MAEEAGFWIQDANYNPVTVSEALGTLFLGVLSLVLLVALLRAQARNRKLWQALHPAGREAGGE
jgi:hypothetical protein